MRSHRRGQSAERLGQISRVNQLTVGAVREKQHRRALPIDLRGKIVYVSGRRARGPDRQ